jgi:hypothetical protein
MNFLRLLRHLRELFFSRPVRYAKFCPAPRFGTRRVEQRLLRRLAWTASETAR